MQFTIPADIYNSNIETVILLDRNPTEESEIRVLTFSADGSPTKQQRVDGINSRKLGIGFVVCCQTAEQFTLIDKYFRSLRGVSTISLVNNLVGGVTRTIQIQEWSVNFKNSLYGDIQARGTLCY